MDSNQLNYIIFFVILIAVSGFFSSAETAFTSANSIRLRHAANAGDKKAALALKLQEKYDSLLSTILIGNNIVNIASSAIATVFFIELFPRYGATIATVVTTISLLLFGEITPKSLGKVYAESVSKRFASPLKFLLILFTPFVWLFEKWQQLVSRIVPIIDNDRISEEELLSIVDEAHLDGSIELKEHRLVKAAIEFDDRDIASILTPRVDIIGFDINDSYEDIEQLYLNTPYSRLIVYNENYDEIIGTMHAKDFFRFIKNKNHDLRFNSLEELITKPLFVPTTISLSNLLTSMQESHTHIGIIMDEYGRMVGIVTMEDVLEELVGEIWDESDVVRTNIKKLSGDNQYLIEGTYSLEKFFDLFEVGHEDEWHSNTVSGFIMEEFDHIPVNNEVLYYKNLKITVVNAHKQRVNEVVVEQLDDKKSQRLNKSR